MTEVLSIDGPSKLKIYYKGPKLEVGPLPAVFYFALAGEESLALDPYCQLVTFAEQLPMRCFSFTLPFHGSTHQRSHAMKLWAESLLEGNSWLEDFFSQCLANIDYLIQVGIVDKHYIAVGGLSRGGFIALQLAARHPDIRHIICHAPLIDLQAHKAFESLRNSNALQSYQSEALIPKLLHKKLFFLIGNRDVCVSTEQCCKFVQELAEAMYVSGKRSPNVELRIFPSIGHQGHGTPPEMFQEGITWLQRQWGL